MTAFGQFPSRNEFRVRSTAMDRRVVHPSNSLHRAHMPGRTIIDSELD